MFRKQIEGKKGKETETRKRKFKVDHIKERKDKHQESKGKKKAILTKNNMPPPPFPPNRKRHRKRRDIYLTT